jgi:DNA-directed RNA polymerase subunit L
MKINTVADEKNMLQIEVGGESHTFMNVLKEELYEDKNVMSAAYMFDHPLVSDPKVIVRTKTASPKKALQEAATRISKQAKDFKTAFSKAAK